MRIRCYTPEDEQQVIVLWQECGLTRPWNDPERDIARKQDKDADLFFLGEKDGRVVACCMAGYDGHRGSINYLCVTPGLRGQGLASQLMAHAEQELKKRGCPKINLMVRAENKAVQNFYAGQDYRPETVLVMGKRLIPDDEEG